MTLRQNPITNYIQTSRQELSKVIWPSREVAIQHTILVIAFSLILAAFFGVVDLGLTKLLELFILR